MSVDRDKTEEERIAELLTFVPLFKNVVSLVDEGKGVPVYFREKSQEVWIDEYSNMEEKPIYLIMVLGVIIPDKSQGASHRWNYVGVDGIILNFGPKPGEEGPFETEFGAKNGKVRTFSPTDVRKIDAQSFIEILGSFMEVYTSKEDVVEGRELLDKAKELPSHSRAFLHGRNAGILEASGLMGDIGDETL